MLEIQQTEQFSKWIRELRDRTAKAKVFARIDRLSLGLAGDTKSVGGSIFEMRIDYGPGYRVYYTMRSNVLILLLLGGDKSTQSRDITKAKSILTELKRK